MFGKKTGFTVKLRKLLAKIQSEFDYPRVFTVYCKVSVRIRKYEDKPSVRIASVTRPPCMVRQLATELIIEMRQGSLNETKCKSVQTLEHLKTQAEVRQIGCWGEKPPPVHRPHLMVNSIGTHDLPTPLTCPTTHTLSVAPPLCRVRTPKLLREVTPRDHLAPVANLPFRLLVQPMSTLSKRELIRYRTSVLKSLNIGPNQVKFVGVCQGLPQAPLQVLKLEPGETYSFVYVRLTEQINELLGRRLWVFIQLRGNPNFIPITLKEE